MCEKSIAGVRRIGIEEEEGPSSEGPDHSGYTEDVVCPQEVVGEDREAHFGSHVLEASGQEVPLVHTPLDRAAERPPKGEGMLDDAFPAFELLGEGAGCVQDL